MKRLAARYPRLVRPFTLPHRTVEGREVHGIEITRSADRVADGKASFLLMGLHHAREWPSAEHAMEFAYDLLSTYRTSDRTARLVDAARTIVVPVINPDGFTVSREAARIGDFGLLDYEMKRKNWNAAPAPREYRGGTCDDDPAAGCAAPTSTATTPASGAARASSRSTSVARPRPAPDRAAATAGCWSTTRAARATTGAPGRCCSRARHRPSRDAPRRGS